MSIVETQIQISNEFETAKAEALKLYRRGLLREARAAILELFSLSSTEDQFLSCYNNWSMIERGLKNYNEAFSIYKWAGYLLNKPVSDFQKGNYYFGRGVNHEETGNPDKALVDYAAARFHYEEARNFPYLLNVENNTAFIFLKAGRVDEALSYLRSAREAMQSYGERVLVAQIDLTIAEAYQKVGDLERAEEYAIQSISALLIFKETENLALQNSRRTYQLILCEMEKKDE